MYVYSRTAAMRTSWVWYTFWTEKYVTGERYFVHYKREERRESCVSSQHFFFLTRQKAAAEQREDNGFGHTI